MKKPKQQTVVERDGEGRPTVVDFAGDSAVQCPACLGRKVVELRRVERPILGDTWEGVFVYARMRCDGCGAHWWRQS